MFTNLIPAAADIIFPSFRAAKLIRAGANVTNSTNPLVITKNVTLLVVACCSPPPVRLAAHCIAAGALIVASVVSPNAITFGSTIHVIKEIYDDC